MTKALYRGTFAFFVSILIGCVFLIHAHAQSDHRYFPETGHTVAGEFLSFYERNPDPILVYGYPITDAFLDPIYGRQVQYFQKARFELYPELSPQEQVRLSSLGKFLYNPGQPSINIGNVPGCTFFQETGGNFQVCYAFLDFFKAHGGVTQFGYPISNLEVHDCGIVQYFQNARFEWRPQLPNGQRVQVTNLGTIHFTQRALDQNYLRQNNNAPQVIRNLNVHAFPAQAVTGLKGQQTIYVVVNDQNQLPVAGAQVTIEIDLPSGAQPGTQIQAHTDQYGLARLALPYQSARPATITFQARARFDGLQGETTSSFQTWW